MARRTAHLREDGRGPGRINEQKEKKLQTAAKSSNCRKKNDDRGTPNRDVRALGVVWFGRALALAMRWCGAGSGADGRGGAGRIGGATRSERLQKLGRVVVVVVVVVRGSGADGWGGAGGATRWGGGVGHTRSKRLQKLVE